MLQLQTCFTNKQWASKTKTRQLQSLTNRFNQQQALANLKSKASLWLQTLKAIKATTSWICSDLFQKLTNFRTSFNARKLNNSTKSWPQNKRRLDGFKVKLLDVCLSKQSIRRQWMLTKKWRGLSHTGLKGLNTTRLVCGTLRNNMSLPILAISRLRNRYLLQRHGAWWVTATACRKSMKPLWSSSIGLSKSTNISLMHIPSVAMNTSLMRISKTQRNVTKLR